MRSLQLLSLFVFPCFLACQQVQEQALLDFTFTAATGQDSEKVTKSEANDIVFQSTDDGQSWQNISAGLPEGLEASTFFARDGELFLNTSNGIYRKSTDAKTAHWKKEMSPEQPLFTVLAGLGEKEMLREQSLTTVSAGSGGLIAFSRNGRFFQKLDGTDAWTPIFKDFKNATVRNVFTAEDGSIFIGCDDGLYKSADQGKTWKQVAQDGWGIEMVESDGVLLCTYQGGILRSADGGEHWDLVLSEGGVGIAVEVIEGGFAAINYNSKSKSRRIRTSTDGGKTWQPIDEGLPPSMLISSIQQVGNYFYCGHPDGIFRSDDRGKTWNLVRPTIGEKVFNLSVSDGVLYAVLRAGGC